MPTNPYFNFYNNRQEQNLVEDLIHESIRMMGFDGYYIPNENKQSRDLIYGDDPLKKFENAYTIAMYLSNSVDPGMNNEFFSKFGLEIKNSVRVMVSRRSFGKNIPLSRPMEGDLIYIPFLSGNGELYEIKFVNDSTDFFTLGRKQPYSWELELELFKYSHEEIDTGIEEIDFPNKVDAYTIEYTMGNGSGNYEEQEYVYQGSSFVASTCSGQVQEWNAETKILTLSNISGVFANNALVIGNSSNTSYYIASYDPMDYSKIENAWDNKVIEDETDSFIDTSETNPFGSL